MSLDSRFERKFLLHELAQMSDDERVQLDCPLFYETIQPGWGTGYGP